MPKKNVSKEHKEKIMEMIKKAGDVENYEVSWTDKGVPVSKEKVKIREGKKSRSSGRTFELKVRKDLEEKGWVVDKWSNNVEFDKEDFN